MRLDDDEQPLFQGRSAMNLGSSVAYFHAGQPGLRDIQQDTAIRPRCNHQIAEPRKDLGDIGVRRGNGQTVGTWG